MLVEPKNFKRITQWLLILTVLTKCLIHANFTLAEQSPPTAPELNILTNALNISLNWTNVDNADGYSLYYAPYPYTGEDSIGSFNLGNINATSFTLWNNATFYTAIKAYNATGESEYSNIELFKLTDNSKNTFVMIHFEAGYKGRLDNNLPINLPEKYRVMDFGWQEYLYETAVKLVQKADEYGFHLSLAFNPQWAEYILLDSEKINRVTQWQEQGHEIAFHHHSLNHPDWNGYSNASDAVNNSIPYLGNVDAGLDFVRNLAEPVNVTTAMVAGLPIDMPHSYENTTEDLIFSSGGQFSSFEQYGELRSLKPYKIVKNNGAKVTYVTHRQLTTILKDFTVDEALEIFKAEYKNTQDDEIYGIVFHGYDYHEKEEIYNSWFEFIKNSGDKVKTINEVISDYSYDISTK